MAEKKYIIVAAMDWGLGHATRCIPIIKMLQRSGYVPVLVSSGVSLTLLRSEFPSLPAEEIVGYQPHYGKNNFTISIGIQIPKFLKTIRKENDEAVRLVEKYNAKAIISDNRYGFYHKNIPSIFITHQLNIQSPVSIPLSGKIINKVIHALIKRFDVCWIPDFPDHVVSGILSKNYSGKKTFVGMLSRFEEQLPISKQRDLIVVLSGPEPQRTLFEQEIKRQLSGLSLNSLIVRGIPNGDQRQENKVSSTQEIDFLNAVELNIEIGKSKYILCRSGYSSIMDLITMRRAAFLVPTHGQTEQEYLADHLDGKFGFISADHKEFSIEKMILRLKDEKNKEIKYPEKDELLVKSWKEIEETYGLSALEVPSASV